MKKLIPNPDKKKFTEATCRIIMNDGYCPATNIRNEDTKCMCREVRLGYRECRLKRFVTKD